MKNYSCRHWLTGLLLLGCFCFNLKGENIKVELEWDDARYYYNAKFLRQKFYSKGDQIIFIISPQNQENRFLVEVTAENLKIEKLSIFKELDDIRNQDIRYYAPAASGNNRVEIEPISLSRTGKIYSIKIYQFKNGQNRLKNKDGFVIFHEDFKTYRRIFLGFHTGFFFPVEIFGSETQSDHYYLKYQNITQNDNSGSIQPLITHEQVYRTKFILFLTFYPGFEPERKIFIDRHLFKRFHFNFGTEFSSSILDKLYIGFGFDFKYFSLNIFQSTGKEDVLDPSFQPGDRILNPNITEVPTIKKNIVRYGVTVSFPFNFVTGWISKFIGL